MTIKALSASTISSSASVTTAPWKRRVLTGWLGVTLVGVVSCERPTAVPLSPTMAPSAPTFVRLTAPVTDVAMGSLSPLARHLVAALRDPSLRRELAIALKDTAASYSLDLQDCRTSSLAKRLFDAGEHEGFGSSSALCAQIVSMNGAILYMAPERLQGWDGSVIPLVSALARPDLPAPATIHAYRSTTRAVEISMAHPGEGPLLVILPVPQQRRALRKELATTPHMIPIHQDTTVQVKR